MNVLSLIIKREFIAKVRNKSFIVMTFLGPLLFVGMSFLIGYLSSMNKDSITEIAIHDESGLLKNNFKNTKHTHYIDLSLMPIDVAKDTANNNYEGLLFIPKVDSLQLLLDKVEYISEDSPSLEFISKVEKVVDSTLTSDRLKTMGLDADKIDKGIVVRNSKKGEKFKALDNKEYVLENEMCVISDNTGILGLGGIIGGTRSGTEIETKNVLIEAAYFSPRSIRKTSKALNIDTDAKFRFERGIDPLSSEEGLQRAAELIKKICGGEVSKFDVQKIEKMINVKNINFLLSLDLINSFK